MNDEVQRLSFLQEFFFKRFYNHPARARGKNTYVQELVDEVKDNEKLYLSKVLQPGDTYKVPEGDGKILSVGKYDGVNVYINGVLSNVIRPQKKMNIYLDKFLNPEL